MSKVQILLLENRKDEKLNKFLSYLHSSKKNDEKTINMRVSRYYFKFLSTLWTLNSNLT